MKKVTLQSVISGRFINAVFFFFKMYVMRASSDASPDKIATVKCNVQSTMFVLWVWMMNWTLLVKINSGSQEKVIITCCLWHFYSDSVYFGHPNNTKDLNVYRVRKTVPPDLGLSLSKWYLCRQSALVLPVSKGPTEDCMVTCQRDCIFRTEVFVFRSICIYFCVLKFCISAQN